MFALRSRSEIFAAARAGFIEAKALAMGAIGRSASGFTTAVTTRPITPDENLRVGVTARRGDPLFDVAGEIIDTVFALAPAFRSASCRLIDRLDVCARCFDLIGIGARPLAHEHFVFFFPRAVVITATVFVVVTVGVTELVFTLARADPFVFVAKALALTRAQALRLNGAHHDFGLRASTVRPLVAINAIVAGRLVTNLDHIPRARAVSSCRLGVRRIRMGGGSRISKPRNPQGRPQNQHKPHTAC